MIVAALLERENVHVMLTFSVASPWLFQSAPSPQSGAEVRQQNGTPRLQTEHYLGGYESTLSSECAPNGGQSPFWRVQQ
jgi:hypothetical protein